MHDVLALKKRDAKVMKSMALFLQVISKTAVLERIEHQMTNQLAPSLKTRRRIDLRVVRERQLEVRSDMHSTHLSICHLKKYFAENVTSMEYLIERL